MNNVNFPEKSSMLMKAGVGAIKISLNDNLLYLLYNFEGSISMSIESQQNTKIIKIKLCIINPMIFSVDKHVHTYIILHLSFINLEHPCIDLIYSI